MTEKPTAAAIFGALEADASPTRKHALLRLKAACDDLVRFGPIKLAAIEQHIRRTAGNDIGPRAQSISNERSRPLGMYHYVAARNRERALLARGQPERNNTKSLSQIIDRITDMDLQTEMRDLNHRMQVAEANFARAKHVLKTLRPGIDVGALLENRVVTYSLDRAIDPAEAQVIVRLLKVLTNEHLLAQCGLCFDDGLVRRRVGTRDILLGRELMKGLSDVCARLNDHA